MRIDDIIIGERHRKDLGDIDAFARDIAEIGLLHPVVVRPDRTLIAGKRRIAAHKLLGRAEVPVTIIDIARVTRGEYSENHFRKSFTPSEYADIADELEPIERAAAKERMLSGKPCGNFPGGAGNALDKVGRIIGKDRKTIEKARAVRDAARAEPDKFGKLQMDMDRTGLVNGVFRQLRAVQQAELIRAEPSPLPGNGPYRVLTIDVPFANELGRSKHPSYRLAPPFPTLSVEQACTLDIASLLTPDACVWMWTTNYHVSRGLHRHVLDAWGLQAKTMLTWGKTKFCGGDWLRGQTEHAILAVRGKPAITLSDQSTLLLALARELHGHSVKPVEFYNLVESLCPAPRYADLFSRYKHNEKWDCHGDEAPRQSCAA
jgi:N6-adenosine-specific RNA methylase IME4